jgi:hypothetical protein
MRIHRVAVLLLVFINMNGLQRAEHPSKGGELMSGFAIIMIVAVAVMIGGGFIFVMAQGGKTK